MLGFWPLMGLVEMMLSPLLVGLEGICFGLSMVGFPLRGQWGERVQVLLRGWWE